MISEDGLECALVVVWLKKLPSDDDIKAVVSLACVCVCVHYYFIVKS